MIKAALTTRVRVFTRDDFGEVLQRLMADVGERVGERTRQDMLTAVQVVPPRRKFPDDYPIEWTSERQRRAYFATDGFGAGIPYRRTGKLSRAWRVTYETRGGLTVTVLNPAPYGRFVYGRLLVDRAAALRPQQRFHQITGWKTAVDSVLGVWANTRRRYVRELRKTLKQESDAVVRVIVGGVR